MCLQINMCVTDSLFPFIIILVSLIFKVRQHRVSIAPQALGFAPTLPPHIKNPGAALAACYKVVNFHAVKYTPISIR